MKKYKVFKDGWLVGSYERRYQAEEAIRMYRHMEQIRSIQTLSEPKRSTYEIRR